MLLRTGLLGGRAGVRRALHTYTLSSPSSDVKVDVSAHGIELYAPSRGVPKPFALDYIWLRDVCQAPGSVQAASQQKLFHTSDIPQVRDGKSILHSCERPVEMDGEELVVQFAKEHPVVNQFTQTVSPDAVTVPDAPHTSRYPLSFLLQHIVPEAYRKAHHDILTLGAYWNAASLAEQRRPEMHAWSDVRDTDAGVLALLTATLRDGFAFVRDVPTEPTGSAPGPDAAYLRALAERIGVIRHTFYGTLWDVRSIASSHNIAYTNVDLGLHMDLLYFQNPPRFQLLHMLRKRVQGGQSLFVDSFRVAERLWVEDREAFEILASTPVAFHYNNAGEHYYYTHPTIELAHDTEAFAGAPHGAAQMPRIVAVNYSPPFQAPLPLHTPTLSSVEKREAFYRALKRFADLTLASDMLFEHTLQEGECVLFDNRRVLHSRKGFDWDASEPVGEVGRWLKGCYVEGDSLWSRYRALCRIHET